MLHVCKERNAIKKKKKEAFIELTLCLNQTYIISLVLASISIEL
jgi:hypothetical protein